MGFEIVLRRSLAAAEHTIGVWLMWLSVSVAPNPGT